MAVQGHVLLLIRDGHELGHIQFPFIPAKNDKVADVVQYQTNMSF